MSSPRLGLLVVADSFGGGLGAAAQAHCRWFADRGWSVALAAPEATGDVIAPAAAINLAVPHGAFDVAGMLRAVMRLRAVLRQHSPRIVHAHGTRSQMVALLAGRVPYVTMHGAGRVDGQGSTGAALRTGARFVASWLAVEAYSAAPAPGRWQTTLHASPRLAGMGAVPESEMSARPTFVWVGRMDSPKQPEVFVEACALAAATHDLRGVMLGGGPRLSEIRELVDRLGAPVEVLGESSDVVENVSAAWAVCLFSGFEGVPFAVQEAMWARRAVVLSPLPSLRWFAGGAAVYAADATSAAVAMTHLSSRDSAIMRGRQAGDRARSLLAEDAPFPQLNAAYAARRSRARRSGSAGG